MGGKDVVTSDDGCVMKGNDHHLDIFWFSSLDRGHGYAGADYDCDGNDLRDLFIKRSLFSIWKQINGIGRSIVYYVFSDN